MMKKEYKAPALTIVAFRAERGFASSGESPIDNVAQAINGTTEFVLQNGQTQWAEGQDQVIGGTSIEGDVYGNTGLAAGHFGQEDVSGSWF